jgi:hypothetical protein
MENSSLGNKKDGLKVWPKREKQIERVVHNISGIFGAMQGITGASLTEIKSLEVKELIEDTGSDDLDADQGDVSF